MSDTMRTQEISIQTSFTFQIPWISKSCNYSILTSLTEALACLPLMSHEMKHREELPYFTTTRDFTCQEHFAHTLRETIPGKQPLLAAGLTGEHCVLLKGEPSYVGSYLLLMASLCGGFIRTWYECCWDATSKHFKVEVWMLQRRITSSHLWVDSRNSVQGIPYD